MIMIVCNNEIAYKIIKAEVTDMFFTSDNFFKPNDSFEWPKFYESVII